VGSFDEKKGDKKSLARLPEICELGPPQAINRHGGLRFLCASVQTVRL
jgi:hypothetical protein